MMEQELGPEYISYVQELKKNRTVIAEKEGLTYEEYMEKLEKSFKKVFGV
jgi:hypothetical protein